MRFIVLVLFLTALTGAAALADDADTRRQWIDGMRRGFAENAKAVGAPNFIDILQARFPDDLNRFADKFIAEQRAGKPLDPALVYAEIAHMLVAIQSCEADRIQSAPASSLKPVLEAHRELIQAASREQPQLCVVMVTEVEARPSPIKEIKRLSAVRLAAIFNALADGRDKPVAARSATDADWEALGADAPKRGYDVKSWEVLLPDKARSSPAPQVCAALLSSTEAILTTSGELGERLLAAQAQDLVIVDPAVYGVQ